tara:strand:- start:938 stop:1417 length:480 start_codon:yes stop_codon:yes gene_type:complete
MPTPPLHEADYLAAEDLMIARLEKALTDIERLKVLSPAELADISQAAQHTPALHVIYAGDRVPGGNATDRGNYHVLTQRWLVVVAVRAPQTQSSGRAARGAAGPIISRVIQALSGWRLGVGFGPLVRINAPGPAYRKGGFGYFPLQFETVIATQAPSCD